MTSAELLSERGNPQGLLRPPISTKKVIVSVCLCFFVIGTVLRIGLDRYWHSVSPRVIDSVTGHTHALIGPGNPVFVTPLVGYVLDGLAILPLIFLVAGMLVWAQSWREWR